MSAFVTTQSEIDSSSDVGEALSDYQFYLNQARPILERHGVHVHATYDSLVEWRDQHGTHALSVSDSGGIAYLFLMPDGRSSIEREGVITDLDILETASKLFGMKLTRRDSTP